MSQSSNDRFDSRSDGPFSIRPSAHGGVASTTWFVDDCHGNEVAEFALYEDAIMFAAARDLKSALVDMLYTTQERRSPALKEARVKASRAFDKSEGRGL